MTAFRRPRWGDAGSYALETVILAPLFFALLGLVIAGGRIQLANGAAENAARAAARAASLERDPVRALSQGREAALRSLADSGLNCTESSVDIDTSGLSAPLGQAATVEATVSCTVPLGDISLPGLPGAKTLDASFSSVVDQFRAR
ncbi:TadE/TadG family type IV pilus assembly protein [Streptomyces xiamenensis]|uniref:TadE/TadG family type IV pilus assembly protein n=1 Tax=Streptomyces xiamenensis TaxID=408015 RepID=UPI0035DC3890